MNRIAGYLALSVLLAFSGAAAQSKAPLRDVPAIDDRLFTIGLADQIRKTCPVIRARMLAALGALSEVQQVARDMGYTRAEVEAHLDSEAEKDRLRQRARGYFEQKGLAQDQAGYCALGEIEIAERTAIGRLLKMEN